MSTNKKGKPISTMKKRGVMSKKRSSKNKMAPKAKSHGLKKKGPATKSSGLVHKAAGAKNEAAPTTKMELRTGTRKSYC